MENKDNSHTADTETTVAELQNKNRELIGENARLKDEVQKLTELNQHLKELVELRTKALFAKKKETIDEKQISLFDDIELAKAEGEASDSAEEAKDAVTDPANAKERSEKRKKSRNIVNLEDTRLPVKTVTHDIENPAEGSTHVGYSSKRTLCFEPGYYYIREDRYESRKKELPDGTVELTSAREPDAGLALSNTSFDPSVVAGIIHSKMSLSLPLYRIEADLARQGLKLTRQTMSNLIYRAYDAVSPVVRLISDYIKSADNVRADETPLTVIELNGGKARLADPEKTAKSYVWGFMTGRGYHDAISYVLGPGRDAEVVSSFLGVNQKRYLQTDGYRAYRCLGNATVNVACLAHIRRKFYDASTCGTKTVHEGEAAKIVRMCDGIFVADRVAEEACADSAGTQEHWQKLKEQRMASVKPKLDEFFGYIGSIAAKVSGKSLLGTAVSYALSMQNDMMAYLMDGRLTLSNNYAEREAMKPFVIGRKNWLFANTRKGGDVSCAMYSLAETAIHNGLDVWAYMKWLISELPHKKKNGFVYSDYLPWSDKVPDWVRRGKRSGKE